MSSVSSPSLFAPSQGYNAANDQMQRVTQRIATGYKISAGKDDPAGLIVSEELKAELRALEAESKTLQRADAQATIADGYTDSLSSKLSEMDRLVTAMANTGGLTDAEQEAYQLEMDSLVTATRSITDDAVGASEAVGMSAELEEEIRGSLHAALAEIESLKTDGSSSLSTGDYEAAHAAVEAALTEVVSAQGKIGAYQRDTIKPLLNSNQVTIANLAESNSRIADADLATETSLLTRADVKLASNANVLKIARQDQSRVLELLR
jgi:flagellin